MLMKVMHLIYSNTINEINATIPTKWKKLMNINAQKKEVDILLLWALEAINLETETIH